MELKLLAMIMGEAVRLGHADANPLVSLKVRRDKAAKKPELTDKEIIEIREALKIEPKWMQTAFDISLHTGCRLRETRLPVDCLDFKENKITFPSPKGGEDRAFSIPMPSSLHPLLQRICKSERKFTLEFPFQPSRRWQQFFIKINKPHLCFHCVRVTYVNRLRRAGVPREAAMRLVNHSSELIHQVYQREKVEDVARGVTRSTFPSRFDMNQMAKNLGLVQRGMSPARNVECQVGLRKTRQAFDDLIISIPQNPRLGNKNVLDVIGLRFRAKPNEIRVFAFITWWNGTGHD